MCLIKIALLEKEANSEKRIKTNHMWLMIMLGSMLDAIRRSIPKCDMLKHSWMPCDKNLKNLIKPNENLTK